MKAVLYTILIVLIIGIIGGFYYMYFYVLNPSTKTSITEVPDIPFFSPFETTQTQTGTTTETLPTTNEIPSETNTPEASFPKLRQLSEMPIAGMSVTSNATSSIVRYMDRGTGHIFEVSSVGGEIKKISNTTLPKIYEAYANKPGSAFIVRYLKDEVDTITNFYAELRGTGASTSTTAYELKGKYISSDIGRITTSPTGDKVFTWNIESGRGVGYASNFDEKNKVKVIDTPLTQVTIDWPEANTVVLGTKASGLASGHMYTVDMKSGAMKSLITGIRGLMGKMSRDKSKFIYTATTDENFRTFIQNTKDNSRQEVIFRTLTDKCVWSTLQKEDIYCAVPSNIPKGLYPDDWYKGTVSFVDQIWHLNTTTEEVHLVANLLDLSDKLMDATNLTLDPKENFLYFVNKEDLTLWSLDLNQ